MRKPRTRFAASFVVTLVATPACTKPPASGGTEASGSALGNTAGSAVGSGRAADRGDAAVETADLGIRVWDVMTPAGARDRALGCQAYQDVQCPPPDQGTCNPPPPTYVECPPDGMSGRVVKRHDDRCVWLPVGCTSLACAGTTPVETACPTYGSLPPTAWLVDPKGSACTFTPTPRCAGERCAVAAFESACPAGATAGRVVRDLATDTCEVQFGRDCPPNTKCNPPAPRAVACPTPPST